MLGDDSTPAPRPAKSAAQPVPLTMALRALAKLWRGESHLDKGRGPEAQVRAMTLVACAAALDSILDQGQVPPLYPLGGNTEVPPMPQVAPLGLADMAKMVKAARANMRGRLVCEHGPGVVEALRPYVAGRPERMPHPGLVPGTGISYPQIEFYPKAGMGPGAWRLTEDGEVIAEGELSGD